VLVEEFGPHQLVPVIPDPNDPDTDPDALPEPTPFIREAQEKRLRSAERKLAALGRVNPLALEEYAALEERHAFLTTQLEDLKASKRDLLDIVREIDERVEQAFVSSLPRHGKRSSRGSSSGCSPAARGGCCSPTPTTC
jgi:chromosome segregation protein